MTGVEPAPYAPPMRSTVLLDESVHIDAGQADVWAAIADYAFDEQWRGGLSAMVPDPPGPPAVGTRVHEVVRFAGRTFTTDSTVTDVDPGSAYEFAGNGTSGEIRGRRSVRPDVKGTGSSFAYEIELKPPRGLRALTPLLTPVLRAGLRRDLRRLKALIETGQRAAGGNGRPGSPCALIEFPADQPERALRFWTGLLGAELTAREAEEGAGWQTRSSGTAVGVHARGRGPGDTSSLPYFHVDDMPAALAQVEALGGGVIHPGEQFAICRDSEGSPFGLTLRLSAR